MEHPFAWIITLFAAHLISFAASVQSDPLQSTQAHVPVEGYPEFKAAVRMRESGGNYEAVNSLGFLGAYQLGEMALTDLGYYPGDATHPSTTNWTNDWQTPHWSEKSPGPNLPAVANKAIFLGNPTVQDRIFDEWFDYLLNQQLIGKHALGVFLGGFRTIDYKGQQKLIEITPTGMFMGAHLRGEYGLANYLKDGIVSVDEFGTPITDYLLEFERFNSPWSGPKWR